MKNMQGFIDPISLTIALLLGIATLGTITASQSQEQIVAQAATVESSQNATQHVANN